jgi:hypothetical protein
MEAVVHCSKSATKDSSPFGKMLSFAYGGPLRCAIFEISSVCHLNVQKIANA